MKNIEIKDIPLFEPTNALAKRIYAYLSKVWDTQPRSLAYVCKDKLEELALEKGFNENDFKTALYELKRVIDCAFYWDTEAGCEKYAVVNMSLEEKRSKIDNLIWFELYEGKKM